jgi:hypothetical protein
MVRLLRLGGVFRAWHAWREAFENLGDPRRILPRADEGMVCGY